MEVIYDPWGNAFGSETSETVDNHFEFANYHWDGTIGMYYLNARWYDPVILRFTGRDPVCGSFEEPMTLHVYLYCLNDPINRTDPSGELWGALRYAYRVVRGVEAYYTMLDVGLQAAGSPWEIMDVAIAASAWREAYFDPANLNKPFAWELAVQKGLGGVIDKITNACDWGPLVGCVVKDYAKGLLKEAPLVVIGEVSCYLCYGDPELISKTGFCIGCGLYRYSNPARIAANIVAVADCVSKHCNW